MAEEVGIVMSLYDRVSPTLKAIAGNTAAFDKNLDDLESSLKEYDKAQDTLSENAASLRKALEASNQKVADARKEYRKLKDDTSKGALDAAIDEQARLKRELAETETCLKINSRAYEDLYDKARKAANGIKDVTSESEKAANSIKDAATEGQKADNRAASGGVSGGADSILSALGKAGLLDMAGDVAMDAGNLLIGSAFGSEIGSVAASGLSGALSGAAMGSLVLPGIGTAVGAAIGGGLGLIQGGTQVAQERDEAFKGYVQDSVEGQLSEMDSIQTSGSATAGQREQDQIAFAQRLGGDEAARDYLKQVQAMAVNTNYSYDEITGYSKSLLNTYDPEETFSVLQKLSDATAGLNLNSSDVDMFIAALSRMRTTGKLTQEYMNYFSERGLDADEAIARGLGVDKSQVRDMASDGEIGGTEAAQAILDYIQEEFGGLSEKLATTYDAMVDNLADAEANLNARMGEGYNEARKSGIEAQQAWLESDQLGSAYEAIGAWKAELENAKEQYVRDAVNEAMGSEEYQSAQAEGDAAEMGRIIMQAKIKGMNEYNANEGKDEVLAQELALIEGVRADASVNENYWNAGYTLGQEFSKGRAAGMADATGFNLLDQEDAERFNQEAYKTQEKIYYETLGIDPPEKNAWGMDRVPYDDYPALLHEGERVLTAREAREQDRAASLDFGRPMTAPEPREVSLPSYESLMPAADRTPAPAADVQRDTVNHITVNVTGNTFGAGMDDAAVAEAIADTAVRKILAGFQA